MMAVSSLTTLSKRASATNMRAATRTGTAIRTPTSSCLEFPFRSATGLGLPTTSFAKQRGSSVGRPRSARSWRPRLCLMGMFLAAPRTCLLLSFFIEESPMWVPKQASDREDVAAKEPTPVRTWIIGVMGCVALQLTGISAVMFYSGKFFDAANYQHKVFGGVMVMGWNFITTLIALVLVNRFGRRGLMLRGLFLIAVSICLLTPMDEWIHNDTAKAAMCFACLGLYILGFEIGPGCLFWVYLPELAPAGSPLFAFCNSLQWLFTLLVTFLFPPLQEAVGGYVFWFFAVPAL
eukprot:Hpha_TRINITY_DN13795_c0_g2::TRINITY_DN13795_c0_g2_i1::g.142822::m.142822